MMVDHVKGSAEVKADECGWHAFVRGSENTVKCCKQSCFGGVVLPVGGLELVEVWRRDDMRLQPSQEEPLKYFGDIV